MVNIEAVLTVEESIGCREKTYLEKYGKRVFSQLYDA